MYDIIPILQHTHVICSTYHLGTRSLGAARILLRGGCNPTTRTISLQNGITYPVIEQWYACCYRDWYIYKYKRMLVGLICCYCFVISMQKRLVLKKISPSEFSSVFRCFLYLTSSSKFFHLCARTKIEYFL